MTNKTLFIKAKRAAKKGEILNAVNLLKKVKFRDVHDALYLDIDLKEFYTHDDVLNHYQRVLKYGGRRAAINLLKPFEVTYPKIEGEPFQKCDNLFYREGMESQLYMWDYDLHAYRIATMQDVNNVINYFETVA